MAFWLVKSDPEEYSFEDLVRDGSTVWTGVRNHQAKKNLAGMKVGDEVLMYHSQLDKAVVGIARVSKAAFPDPTDDAWLSVELTAVHALQFPVTLDEIRNTPGTQNMAVVLQPRLSVMPVTEAEWKALLRRERA